MKKVKYIITVCMLILVGFNLIACSGLGSGSLTKNSTQTTTTTRKTTTKYTPSPDPDLRETDPNGSSSNDGEQDGTPAQNDVYYRITFKDYDGTVLDEINVKEGEMPTYDKESPVRESDQNYSYVFSDWDPEIVEANNDATYTATYIQFSLTYQVNGNSLYFGMYPQTNITEEKTVNALKNRAGAAPTSRNPGNWIDYEYYRHGEVASFMWYQDVEYKGEKYRGVYFSYYREADAYFKSRNSLMRDYYQHENGYYCERIYWFKYEPIEWKILKRENNKVMIISNLLLDCQYYHPSDSQETFYHNGGTGYAANYKLSYIRKWLNNDFYNATFSNTQKSLIQTTIVDNSAQSTGLSYTTYICDSTNDKMFLLSYKEVDGLYRTDADRQARGSDYAKVQGLYVDTSTNSRWVTRSPRESDRTGEATIRNISYDGVISIYGNKPYSHFGVRPACWVTL